MHVGAGAAGKAVEEVMDELGLEIAHEAGADPGFEDNGGSAAEIDGSQPEGFIHRHKEITGAVDSFLVAQGHVECLAQCDANVFNGVVLVNVEIAGTAQLQIESTMAREELKHVIEETDPGCDFVLAGAFESERDANVRFVRLAVQFGFAHGYFPMSLQLDWMAPKS